jgi:hypothetical protein
VKFNLGALAIYAKSTTISRQSHGRNLRQIAFRIAFSAGGFS